MAKLFMNPFGTDAQLNEFMKLLNTFDLRSTVLSEQVIKPGLISTIEIQICGKQEEMDKLIKYLKNPI